VVLLMLNAVALFSHEVRPDLWERQLDLVLEGLRASPGQLRLSRPALTDDELALSTRGWQPIRR
jgi:hypothetical protein